MKKIIVLIFIALQVNAQIGGFLLADSSDVYLNYNSPKYDSLKAEILKPNNQDFLKNFSKKFATQYDYQLQYKKLLEANVDEWEMQLFEQKAVQLEFLKNEKLSKYLSDHLESEIKYNYWHLIFAYPIIRGNNDQKLRRVISLPNVMIEAFKNSQVNDEKLLEIKSFRAMLMYWITYKNSQGRDFIKYSDQLQSVNDKVEFALKNLKGNVLDYALALILQNNKLFLSTKSAKNILSQISNPIIQEAFFGTFLDDIALVESHNKQLVKEREENEAKKSGAEFMDIEGKAFDFSKYKGKVVYVDFWASWCGPCKAEFPFSKKLKASLSEKDRSKIVFLYISLDDDQEKWKNGIKANELEEFENGYAEGAWASKIVQKYLIKTIPRYMLIDMSGKVVNPNAKRPSNPDTFDELMELIK